MRDAAQETPPDRPGETILEDVLKPLDMSVNQLANNLGVTATRLNDIVRGRRGVTADTALRLARYLGTSAEFWLGLQLEYDLRMTRQAKQKEIERAVRPRFRGALNLGVSSGREERDPRERNHGFVPLGAAIQNARKNWISETEQLGTSDRSGNIT